MKKNSYLAIAMLGASTFAPPNVGAQTAVTDPGAPAPPVVYQSVFNQSPTGVETKSVDWKKANAEVAQFMRGHVDILKWEEAEIKSRAMNKPSASPTTGTPLPGIAKAAEPEKPAKPAVSTPPSPPSPAHKH